MPANAWLIRNTQKYYQRKIKVNYNVGTGMKVAIRWEMNVILFAGRGISKFG